MKAVAGRRPELRDELRLRPRGGPAASDATPVPRKGGRPSTSSNFSIRAVRVQVYQFELFELIPMLKLDKPVEIFLLPPCGLPERARPWARKTTINTTKQLITTRHKSTN